MRFKDRVVIITGGGCGLGRAVVLAFAREGAVPVIMDISMENARNTAAEVEGQGGCVLALQVDATVGRQVKDAVSRVIRELGKIDILINNVGWTESVNFLETDEALWRKSLDINLMAPLHFCREVLPHMVERKYGRVVNIASVAGRQPRPMAVVYSAAKAGVISLTRSLAVAMAPHNIRVNSVSPCTMDTGLLKEEDPEHLGPILKQVTLGRLSQPEEVSSAVLFLASDEASYILGQSLHVDGGNCML